MRTTPLFAGAARSCESAIGLRLMSSSANSGAFVPTAAAVFASGSCFVATKTAMQKNAAIAMPRTVTIHARGRRRCARRSPTTNSTIAIANRTSDGNGKSRVTGKRRKNAKYVTNATRLSANPDQRGQFQRRFMSGGMIPRRDVSRGGRGEAEKTSALSASPCPPRETFPCELLLDLLNPDHRSFRLHPRDHIVM